MRWLTMILKSAEFLRLGRYVYTHQDEMIALLEASLKWYRKARQSGDANGQAEMNREAERLLENTLNMFREALK